MVGDDQVDPEGLPEVVERCCNGHDVSLAGRNTQGACRQCHREADKRWKRRHPGQYSAGQRRFYLSNPRQEYHKARREKETEEQKAHRRAVTLRSRHRCRGVNFWVQAAKESE